MKNKEEIEFIYPLYKTRENIPIEFIEILDEADQLSVDTDVPPRFDCEKCHGKMVPIYYVGVKGKIYKYEN